MQLFRSNLMHNSGCKTNGGNRPNVACAFPFRFENAVYSTCITKDHDSPWCPTKLDYNGNCINDHWGTCSRECPVTLDGKNGAFTPKLKIISNMFT